MKILICDNDEKFFREIQSHFAEKGFEESHLLAYVDTIDEYRHYLQTQGKLDVLMMNVEFDGNSGIHVVKDTKELLRETRTIFLADEWKFVTETYEVEHLAYVRKKDAKKYLIPILQHLEGNVQEYEDKLITPIRKGTAIIEKKEILYVERVGRISIVYTRGERFESKWKLSELMEHLDEEFIRCHNSYIVNLNKVCKYIRGEFTLGNGKHIPISRSKQADLRKLMDKRKEAIKKRL